MKYKVVTKNLKSLGLRKNPNILKYHIGKWKYLHRDETKSGRQDYGGIWVCNALSGANKLKQYMKNKHNITVRIFTCLIDKILYQNSYRLKTNGIKLIKEIK